MFGWFRKRQRPADRPADARPSAPPEEPERQDEKAMIRACRKALGLPPRSLSFADAQACRLRLTPELETPLRESDDELLRILDDQTLLRDHGRIYWGHLVQANQLLFDPDNPHTLPANVIYSTDRYFDGRVEVLARLAHGLFAQKGTVSADPELREFVRIITDEMERLLRRELPRGYCQGRSVYFATFFIQPGHLPDNHLARSSFPLLVDVEETEAVMILPSRFWPEELIERWRA